VKILFALPGLHRIDRGAEISFIAVASELARLGEQVTLIGSGQQRDGQPYRFVHVPALPRERFEHFPKLPVLRGDTAWEELSFLPGLLRAYRPADYDVTLTCGYPFTNWALRRPTFGGRRPAHVFVTQNGDWPATDNRAEFRLFDCDGLVCINPDFEERNRHRYRCALIPNGVDRERFTPGPAERERFGLDPSRPVVLMVSAMISSKNIARGIEAVSRHPDALLVIAGDGPLRDELEDQAARQLPGRYRQVRVDPAQMPALYRSADVFLHLSRDESFGNVYVEAMACGTPIVAYDLPRTRWIVADEAFLCGVEDPAALALVIGEALKQGPERQARLVRRSAEFGWPAIALKYRDFLREVISATRQACVDAGRPS
jgi:glycosyltransferase involved in cell wall biosynthesis